MKIKGYTLIELVVTIAILGIVMTALVSVNKTIITSWKFNQNRASLQQELRVSMNSLINNLISASEVKLDGKEISFISQDGKRREIYYQSDVGLYLNDKKNIISNRITDAFFELVDNNLLIVELAIKKKKEEFNLKTGIRVQR